MDNEYESARLRALVALNVLDTESDTTFDSITELVANVFDAPISLVSMVDKDRLYFKSSYGTDATQMDREDTFCDAAIEHKEPLIVTDASSDKRFMHAAAVSGEPYFKFYAGVPLVTSQGFAVGTLCFTDFKPRPALSQREIEKLQSLAAITIQNIELKAPHGDIEANTGLPTEIVAIREIDDWRAKKPRPVSLLAVELLGSEIVSVGPAVEGLSYNSQLIKASVSRIIASQPAGTKTYYLGLDRYLCVVPNSDWDTGSEGLSKLVHSLSKPLFVDSREFIPNVRIGLKAVDGNHDVKSDVLVRHAISALEQARDGSKAVARYDEALDNFLSQRYQLLSQLPQALKESNQFYLDFQPIVDLKTGEYIELECLMRWQHPEYGNISPGILIPQIETTSLMQEITLRVIDLAIDAANSLRDSGWSPRLAVNITPFDLHSEPVLERLQLACSEVGADRMIVELTETAIVKDLQGTFQQLARLRDMGIRVHIDDFGVGQSSLSYLASVPADAIKLDQSFIREALAKPGNIQVASSVSALARDLGFEVILEGVENSQGIHVSKTVSPDAVQGYGISRPMNLARLSDWIRQNQSEQAGEMRCQAYVSLSD